VGRRKRRYWAAMFLLPKVELGGETWIKVGISIPHVWMIPTRDTTAPPMIIQRSKEGAESRSL
jgi:hypothetical protein